jgi:DAK2 domain fusion protein YloV
VTQLTNSSVTDPSLRDPETIKAIALSYRDLLASHQELINRLNVYPVPDGDTGTNMTLTLENVAAEINGQNKIDRDAILNALSHGSLMGARGNSGIILSQILRAFAGALNYETDNEAELLAKALDLAADSAIKAVGKPVEGTILTAIRRAADSAIKAAESASLFETAIAARDGALRAMNESPELLPILKESGVVDAGAAGLVLFFEAIVINLGGSPLGGLLKVLPDHISERLSSVVTVDSSGLVEIHAKEVAKNLASVGDLRYEVMFILEANDDQIEGFKDVWAGIGDSIVVVGESGLYNCHIHTGEIGAAIEAALDIGRPKNIRVTDLAEQVEEEAWVRATPTQLPPKAGLYKTAVVAVCSGEGIKRIFHSLGVQQTILGGQSMNPSTKEILDAIEATAGQSVIILPNNKNVTAVALEAAKLSERPVKVIPTESVTQGFAALLEYDPDADIEKNFETMSEAYVRVVTGEIVQAVREASSGAGHIEAGDWLGVSQDGILVVEKTMCAASCKLLQYLISDQHELVTVIEGELANVADTRHIESFVKDNYSHVEIEVHHGGQPLYPYLFSIE